MIYTYFFYSKKSGLTKIGKTKSPKRRFSEISKSDPSLVPLAVYKGDSELLNHTKYKEFRKYGEWFKIPNIELIGMRMDKRDLPDGDLPPKMATLMVSNEVHFQIKMAAAQTGVSMIKASQEIVERGMKQFLRIKAKKEEKKP